MLAPAIGLLPLCRLRASFPEPGVDQFVWPASIAVHNLVECYFVSLIPQAVLQ